MVTRGSDGERHSPETLVERARSGDKGALEDLVRAVRDPVYGLSLRMLGEPADAEDATQEILVKVITRLDSYRGESRFLTWVYAVAANHLRTMRRRGMERYWTSFEQMTECHTAALPEAMPPRGDRRVLTREIRLQCLHGSLICLDRDHRMAFVLGDSLELNSVEAAQVLGIEPATYRKRLSRARKKMQDFMLVQCGLVRPDNDCHCENWCDPAVDTGVVDPDLLKLAGQPCGDDLIEDLEGHLEGLDELVRIRVLFRSLPAYRAPDHLVNKLTEMMGTLRGTPAPQQGG